MKNRSFCLLRIVVATGCLERMTYTEVFMLIQPSMPSKQGDAVFVYACGFLRG